MADRQLPSGTVTLLFTDIEGSTRLVEALEEDWPAVLETHNRIVSEGVETNGGTVVKTEGDSFFAVFEAAADGVRAAVSAQRQLNDAVWPQGISMRVRMGLHTGRVTLSGSDYVGLDVHRAARIAEAAHGGQIVVSEATAVLVEHDLSEGVSLRDLGKHRLKDLTEPETIFQVSVLGLESDFPEIRTLEAIPNNLPMQITSFVGRERELKEARRLLERTRVLTLTGPGGSGKTRLSLQVAAELSGQFEDGVFFVDLSPITETEVIPSAILRALGLPASGKDQSPSERLLNQIGSSNLLFVLDNYEHLLEGAPLVAEMVRASPRSRFIVTSRAPLRITGEQEMPVPPLEVAPDADLATVAHGEGVLLLIDRAMAVRPDFRITESNVNAVVDLVRKLDGLPLAIELVASRLRFLSVEAVLERLDTRMLSAGSVDLPQRQQTIENAIAWSHELLDEAERDLFARLGVFAGGARLEEIEAICSRLGSAADPLEGLATLVDHSLVLQSGTTQSTRFRMLFVIREYALERLEEKGATAETRKAHLDIYHRLLEEAAPQLLRHDRGEWLDLLDADHDNIRAALEWGIENGETDLVLDLVSTTWRFWQARGHLHEARRRIEEALSMQGGAPAKQARALEALGGVLWWEGKMERCQEVYERALQMQRKLEDGRALAMAIYNLCLVRGFYVGDHQEALADLEEARAIYTELDDTNGLADVEWAHGNIYLFAVHQFDKAQIHLARAAELYKEAGNEFGRGWALFEMAETKLRAGEPVVPGSDAWSHLTEGMELFASHGDVSAIVLFLAVAAGMAHSVGDSMRAYRLAGASDGLRVSSGTDLVSYDVNLIEGLEPPTLAALEGEAAEAFHAGSDMDLDEAVAYTLGWGS